MTVGHPTQVNVSGGKGAVVGDYNTVFNFEVSQGGQPTIASFIRVKQFAPLVNERINGFVGRAFVFERVADLIGGSAFESGYIVIRGEPGIGKTAIAARLIASNGYVHHFNIAPENIRTARQFLENVCAQLIVRYQLDHKVLPPQAGEDAGFLVQLLGEAVMHAGAPLVVVVDALDEADESDVPPDANRLFLPRVLPRGVFFVVTSREEADHRLDVDHEDTIWIRKDDPSNLDDVARYIASFVDARRLVFAARLTEWNIDEVAFSAAIAALSEGNFMYLTHVLRDIATGKLTRDTVGDISKLPRGLRSYYERHWRQMRDADEERFKRLQRPVLCFLAISGEPVNVLQLIKWTGLDMGEVKAIIREWREFLNEDDGHFRIYHRSFSEFLDDHEGLRWYHGQVGAVALAKIPGF